MEIKSKDAKALLANKNEFLIALHTWFKEHKRDLPWRKDPSLYKTVVSELMLQQTQVDTVLPYFDRWLKRFPSFEALAKAREDVVLKHWEGLGYYSRARNLHKLAKIITELPSLPQNAEEWQKLPGIGPYTSAAIASIAQKQPAACVDGNVVRILTRLAAIGTAFKTSTDAAKALRPLAEGLVHSKEPGRHNEAMMELGATVCTKAKPLCTVCPVVKLCAGAKKGNPTDFPKLLPKTFTNHLKLRGFLQEKGKLLLHKSPESKRRLSNIWELPLLEDLEVKAQTATLLLKKKRGIGQERITEEIYKITPTLAQKKRWEKSAALKWIDAKELEKLILSGPHRKWIATLLS